MFLNDRPIRRDVEFERSDVVEFGIEVIGGNDAVRQLDQPDGGTVCIQMIVSIDGKALQIVIVVYVELQRLVPVVVADIGVLHDGRLVVDGEIKGECVLVALAFVPIEVALHREGVHGVVGKPQFAHVEFDQHIAARLLAARRIGLPAVVARLGPDDLPRNAVRHLHVDALCAAQQTRRNGVDHVVAVFRTRGGERSIPLHRRRHGIALRKDIAVCAHAPRTERLFAVLVLRIEARHGQRRIDVGLQLVLV